MAEGMVRADTSTYPTGPQNSPMKAMSDTVNLLQGVQQLGRGNLEIEANKATGRIIQKHTGPDGTVNWNGAMLDMSKDPAATYNLGQTFELLRRIQGQEASNIQTNLENDYKKNQFFAAKIGGIMSNPDVGMKDVMGVVADALKEGYLDAPRAASVLGQLSGVPKEKLPGVLKQLFLQHQRGADVQSIGLQGIGDVRTGGTTTRVQQDISGKVRTLGTFADTPTTEQLNATTVVKDKEGIDRPVPRAQVAPMVDAAGRPFPPASPSAGAGGTPGGATPPSLPPAPSPKPSPAESVELAPSPVEQAQLGNAAKEVEERMKRQANGREMTKLISAVRDFTQTHKTGPGNEIRATLGRVASMVGVPEETVDKLAGGNLGSQDALRKVLFQIAMTGVKDYTGRDVSNLELGTNLAANINLETDPRATKKLLKMLEAKAQAMVDEPAAFEEWKKATGKRGGVGFQDFWNRYVFENYYGLKKNAKGQWTLPED